MARNGKVYRKFKMSVIKSMVTISFCAMMVYPLTVSGKENTQEDSVKAGSLFQVSGDSSVKNEKKEDALLYEVCVNDKVVGYVDDADMAEDAYLNARLQINAASDSMVYMDASLAVNVIDDKKSTLCEEDLQDAIYDLLMESVVTPKEPAYTLKIGDVTVHLADTQEVVALFERIKDKYDAEDAFEVVLAEKEDTMFTAFTAHIVLPETEENSTVIVYAPNGEYDETDEEEVDIEDGLKVIEFEEDIEIVEAFVSESQLMTAEEAFEFLTKENEEKQIYKVVKGDCMWNIAKAHGMTTSQLFALNENITEKSILRIGQEVVITVPEPELSVITKEVVTYDEYYNAPVQYVYNDSWYTTKSVVLQEGTEGYHNVSASVSYRNGKEYDREILEETIIEESTPKIIEVGTITPPTFIRPVNGGRVTSNYGWRAWQGKVHTGIDYGISTGTKVMASCGGKVVQAGWNGGYGYCITIQHANGIKTRYAHLSKVLVSVGQYVSQGQKIALSGNTGNSTGPHLHFEVIVSGRAVDPRKYLN
ncbi:MAG: LysM peptidoglycan-binding domain-containing protein [Lachnospiraceae bacterium]|nr:LysM peptidoglycan-binding domain-containing protein [Lachnospiraceae bacterium]